MNNIIDFSMQRKRAILMVLFLILVSGFYTYVSIPREDTPDVKIPIIYVSMTHEGISPEDAEDMLIKPMEVELRSIEGIKEIKSNASEGFASVVMEFSAGFDSKKALQDVREKVETAKAELPSDTDEPKVSEVNLSTFPVLNIILYGDVPERALYQIADTLEDKVEAIPEVLSVDIAGKKEEMIEVIISPVLLESYGLTSDIVNITASNNLLIAAGAMDSEDGKYVIKVPGLIDGIEDILDMPLIVEGDNVIRIKDVAEVRKSFKDSSGYAKVNGKSAVVVEVSKRTGENIIDTIAKVKAIVKEEQRFWPKSVQLIYSQDKSSNIIDMVNELQNNILLAIILVVVVIMAFVGFKAAGLVAFSIPGAFLIGVLTIGFLDLTLNVVVLFSLIMSVGMLVDSAIVVIEYANRRMAEGESFKTAYQTAAKRMAWPIIASTVTTLIVFTPLLFWPGIIGQFMKYMPLTLIATLSGSLVMALIFMPVVGSIFGKADKDQNKEIEENIKNLETGNLDDLTGVSKVYVNLLGKIINYSGLFSILIVALMAVVISIYSSVGKGVEFFPEIEPENIQVVIRARGNLSTIEKDEIVNEVLEKILHMKDEVRVFYSRSGKVTGGGKSFPEDTIGVITLEMANWQNRRTAKEIIKDIRQKTSVLPGVLIEVLEQSGGPSAGKKINIEVSSRFPDMIDPVVEKILNEMQQDGRFVDIADTRPAPEIEWKIDVDRGQASKFGVSMATLGNFIKLITNGLKITTYRPDEDDEELDIMLRYPKESRKLEQLDNLKVMNNFGGVPISNFVERTAHQKIGTIERVNGLRTIKIEADPSSGILADTLVKDAQKFIEQAYANEEIDPRVSISFKGENEDQAEASSFLANAFILAIFGMMLVLTFQFNSIYQMSIIMSAIVLSTIGVFIALMITGQPFGIVMCGVGIISLAGIVVNNNIIFIDTYKLLREQGIEVKEALLRTGAQRLRPILLTAGTTVLGLLPMVFQMNINFLDRVTTFGAPSTQWWQQLSTTIAGGLSFSTVLTLFLTPCLLFLGEKLFHRSKNNK